MSIKKIFRNSIPHPFRNLPLTFAQNQQAAQRWKHPSDHLPAYAQVNECRFGTHNVLNNHFIHHIESIPFWNESNLVRASKTPSKTYTNLSEREEDIVKHARMLLREENVLDTLCLQECSDRMCALFKEVLEPLNIAVIIGNGNLNNHVVILINKDTYRIEETKISAIFQRYIPKLGRLVWDQWRPAIDVKLESKKTRIGFPEKKRFVNLHISSAGETEVYKIKRLQEVCGYLDAFPCKSPSIVCGDFNANAELTDSVFSGKYTSLRSHHTQVECIPTSEPKIVSIDDLRVSVDKDSQQMVEGFSIDLKKADPAAHDTYQESLAPFIPA